MTQTKTPRPPYRVVLHNPDATAPAKGDYTVYTLPPRSYTEGAKDTAPPLTHNQRVKIQDYLTQVGQYSGPDSMVSDYCIYTVQVLTGHKPPPVGLPVPNPLDPGTTPGGKIAHGFSSTAEAITHFFDAVFDPTLWLRIGEVLIGLVLVGVGAAKLSGNVGSTLKKIPVYGKAIPA